MRRGALDHAAQRDDRVELAGLGEALRGMRDLGGPRDANEDDVLRTRAMAHQTVLRPLEQLLGEEAVEAAQHDAEFPALCRKLTCDFLHA